MRCFLVGLLLAATLPLLTQQAHSPLSVSQVHLSISGIQDPSDSITVTWATDVYAESYVQYSRTNDFTTPSQVQGITYTYPASSRYYHVVQLSGLTPSTTYYYRTGDPALGFGPVYSFTTAPVRGSQDRLTITVYGDQGTQSDSATVASMADAESPQVSLLVGDTSYCSDQQCEDYWFDINEPLASGSLFMVAAGNHEYFDPDNMVTYLNRFNLPGADAPSANVSDIHSERWYSFDWGSTHLVSIDLGDWEGASLDQSNVQWLTADLEAARNSPLTRWIIVFHHFAFYTSSTTHGIDDYHRSTLEPLYLQYGVDLVLNGHEHNYERTHPVANDVPSSTDPSSYGNPGAPIYIVEGRGGEGLYSTGNSFPWSAARFDQANGYTRIDIEGDVLTSTAFRIDTGQAIDSFSLIKGPFPVAQFEVSPESFAVGETLTFDASSSYHTNGTIAAYDWDFGDGTSATGKIVQHKYETVGTYTARLILTDTAGRRSSTTKLLNLAPRTQPWFPLVIPQEALMIGLGFAMGLPLSLIMFRMYRRLSRRSDFRLEKTVSR